MEIWDDMIAQQICSTYGLYILSCEIAIVALMTYMRMTKHDFHWCVGDTLNIDYLPCPECGAGL